MEKQPKTSKEVQLQAKIFLTQAIIKNWDQTSEAEKKKLLKNGERKLTGNLRKKINY